MLFGGLVVHITNKNKTNYRNLKDSDDSKLKCTVEKIRVFCNKIVIPSNKLTELIKHCDNKIIKISQVMVSVKDLTA
ncbi:hypothetical protein [Aeromonas phage ZPAH34]|uniref:hypothetical protein n=1 Tax=Aeromonas phage ZPAH34 TaxID=2924888 RepID=UPI002329279E|nr:hypothetical protein PQD16_gp131 [Aeromonas phage ZPAH34]UOX39552.1 hypothetical protein [Aeromonas phage ZPAH34]